MGENVDNIKYCLNYINKLENFTNLCILKNSEKLNSLFESHVNIKSLTYKLLDNCKEYTLTFKNTDHSSLIGGLCVISLINKDNKKYLDMCLEKFDKNNKDF